MQTSAKFVLAFFCILILLVDGTVLAQPSIYTEAPMLSELVASGALPPVDERMPSNPVLITPIDEVGVFGGTWRIARIRNDYTIFPRYLHYEGLVRWDVDWTRVVPNLAQSIAVNEDSTVFTFSLRQGVRWSDGEPFTADDIMFWYQDVYLRPELKATHFIFLNGMEDDFVVEKLDDFTVQFRFNAPYGMFLQQLATVSGTMMTVYPKHFLMQYLPDYNPNIDALIADEGAVDWVELFNKHRDGSMTSIHPGTPALFAWIFEAGTQISDTVGAVFTAVRNPYYWKIDTEFNQLPYIDRVEFSVVENEAEVLERARAGEIDMQDRTVPVDAFTPENQAAGGYGSFTSLSTLASVLGIWFNQTVDDPVKREIFQNRDFRIGLSYALNRQAMIDTLGFDTVPQQLVPIAGSPFYDETAAQQFTEYNPELANQYLDQAGYSNRNAAGVRLGPTGEPISVTIMASDPTPSVTNLHTLISQIEQDWEAVGIDVNLQVLPPIEFHARFIQDMPVVFNQYEVAVFIAEGGYDVLLNPEQYVPVLNNPYAPRWAAWANDPTLAGAEEPPADIQQQIRLYRQLQATGDQEQQIELMRQILDIYNQQFNTLGTMAPPIGYGIVRPNFHNVPQVMFSSWSYPNPAPANPSQFYIDPQF